VTSPWSALPPTISVPEAGRLLGLSRNGAYAAASRGEIPVIRLGRKLVVPTVPIVQMLAGQRAQTQLSRSSVSDKQRLARALTKPKDGT
jgi:hypothetical protein